MSTRQSDYRALEEKQREEKRGALTALHDHMMTPQWEKEAKRAFWAGLEIGASMGQVSIAPRWQEYVEKRREELRR